VTPPDDAAPDRDDASPNDGIEALASIRDAVHALEPRIRAASAEIERARRLPDWLVDEMAAARLYRLLIPSALGGRGLDPLAYFDLVEQLARIDSAVAWSVLISTSTTTGLARGLPDAVVGPMIADPRAIIMGSGPPKGRAVAVPGGYRVTGRWTQGSNVEIATWVHVGCIVYHGDQPLVGADGRPEHRMCAMPAAEVQIHDTWNTTGMRGTGSHDFGFTGCFVPEERTQIAGAPSRRPEPIFQFPGWTHAAHGALGLGIARVAIDAFLELAGGKRATWLPGEGDLSGRGTVQAKVAEAEALVGASGAYLRQTLSDLWATVSARQTPTPRQRAVYRLALAQGMAQCVRAVDLMFSAGGASAIYATSALDRCLRDIHTAHAHVWVAPDNYEIAGRLLLGLDPGTTTI
jgi:alkylation response protein AidB-like acyl-CoA dehydrogenase